MKVKIRKGDTVEIISGKIEEKGKRGEVIKVLPNENAPGCPGLEHPYQAPEGSPDAGPHH